MAIIAHGGPTDTFGRVAEALAGNDALPAQVNSPLDLEKEVLDAINAERERIGQHHLTWNDRLFTAARGHSTDMATNDFFDHMGSDGRSFSQRITDSGYTWRAAAENIGAGQLSAQHIVDSWMNSPGHRENMLNDAYCEAGVGYAASVGSRYLAYWTLDLAIAQGVSQCIANDPADSGADASATGSGPYVDAGEATADGEPVRAVEQASGGGGCFITVVLRRLAWP
jgi:uncharacterized protein YkwD